MKQEYDPTIQMTRYTLDNGIIILVPDDVAFNSGLDLGRLNGVPKLPSETILVIPNESIDLPPVRLIPEQPTLPPTTLDYEEELNDECEDCGELLTLCKSCLGAHCTYCGSCS